MPLICSGIQRYQSLGPDIQGTHSGLGGSTQETRELSTGYPEMTRLKALAVPDADVVSECCELHAVRARGIAVAALPPFGHRFSSVERIRSAEARCESASDLRRLNLVANAPTRSGLVNTSP